MSRIGMKTIDEVSVQSKPTVYICCSPEDGDRYYEELSNDIFRSQDCVVCCRSDWNTSGKNADMETCLGAVNLFVVPVTLEFLTEKNSTVDMEYSFAMEHHIPVLSIGVEANLKTLFSKVMNDKHSGYGNVQYLERMNSYRTWIPYSERLDKILSSVLYEKTDDLQETMSAAEKGNPEAMKTLADCYRNGDGVAVDVSKAMMWYGRLCHCRTEIYNADLSSSHKDDLLKDMITYAEMLWDCRNYAAAKDVLLYLAETVNTGKGIGEYLIRCYTGLGCIAREEGYAEEAEKHFRRAIETAELNFGKSATAVYREQLITAKYILGLTEEYMCRNIPESKSLYEDVISLLLKKMNLSERIIDECIREQKGFYTDVLMVLPEEERSANLSFLAEVYDSLARITEKEGKACEATVFNDKSLEIRRWILNDDDSLQAWYYFSVAQIFAADNLWRTGEYEGAEEVYLDAEKSISEYCHYVQTNETLTTLFRLYVDMEHLYLDMGIYGQAISYEEKAASVLRRLQKK